MFTPNVKEKVVSKLFSKQHSMAGWETEEESDNGDEEYAVEIDSLSASLGTLTMASSSCSSRGQKGKNVDFGMATDRFSIKWMKERPRATKKNTMDDAKGDAKDDGEHKSETQQKQEPRMAKCEQGMTNKRKGHVRQPTPLRAWPSQTRTHYPRAPPPKSNEPKALEQDDWLGEGVWAKDWFIRECEERGMLPWDSESLDLLFHVDSEHERIVTSDDSDPTGSYLDI